MSTASIDAFLKRWARLPPQLTLHGVARSPVLDSGMQDTIHPGRPGRGAFFTHRNTHARAHTHTHTHHVWFVRCGVSAPNWLLQVCCGGGNTRPPVPTIM